MHRILLLAAALILVGLGAGCNDSASPPALALRYAPTMPLPDEEDSNALGKRQWLLAPTITIRVLRTCRDVTLETTANARFDGNRFSRGRKVGGTFGGSAPGLHRPGFTFSETDEAYGGAGESVRFRATAECHLPGGGLARAHASRRYEVPAATCFLGPTRAYEVRGRVTREDDDYEGRVVPLRPGDLVGSSFATLRVARGARVVLGAPECNGFRIELGPGTYEAGGYDAGSRGDAFGGRRIVARGDRHAGGFDVGRLSVLPLDASCGRNCPLAPSEYEVRSGPHRTTVRVSTGAVEVIFGPGPVKVRAGFQLDVLCATPGSCRRTRPRLFQPHEPWSTPAEHVPRPLTTVFFLPKSRTPPMHLLAPEGSEVEAKELPAAGGVPKQVLVVWSRELRTHGASEADDLRTQRGVLVWERTPLGANARWHAIYARRYLPYVPVGSEVGDVTGDGHPDVLLAQLQGSGGCGPWTVLAAVRGRVRKIFERDTCEWYVRLEHGSLVIDQPVGPCPFPQGSVHCFGGRRTLIERWNGRRLRIVRTKTVCYPKRLDPASGCRRNLGRAAPNHHK